MDEDSSSQKPVWAPARIVLLCAALAILGGIAMMASPRWPSIPTGAGGVVVILLSVIAGCNISYRKGFQEGKATSLSSGSSS